MKKIVFVLFVFGLINFASAQNITGDLDMKAIMSDKIQDISVKMCDNTKELFNSKNSTIEYKLRPGASAPFCINLKSKFDTGVYIKYGFVDGTLSDHGTVVCDQNLATGNLNFFPFVSSQSFLLKANSNLNISELVRAQAAKSSNLFCFVYWIDEDKTTKKHYINGMFDLLIRKNIPIKVTADGKEYSFQWFDDLVWQIKKLFL